MEFQLIIAAVASIAALGMVVYLAKSVLAHEQGTEEMKEISRMVQVGAQAFLKREYMWVASFVLVIAVLFTDRKSVV